MQKDSGRVVGVAVSLFAGLSALVMQKNWYNSMIAMHAVRLIPETGIGWYAVEDIQIENQRGIFSKIMVSSVHETVGRII